MVSPNIHDVPLPPLLLYFATLFTPQLYRVPIRTSPLGDQCRYIFTQDARYFFPLRSVTMSTIQAHLAADVRRNWPGGFDRLSTYAASHHFPAEITGLFCWSGYSHATPHPPFRYGSQLNGRHVLTPAVAVNRIDRGHARFSE